ncbi:MAG: ATP phosphoribosyltransferase [Bacteroidetes bacterium]|nr:MAG: ATP phosphoribosyltransferase [Bacteroidota bacterium]
MEKIRIAIQKSGRLSEKSLLLLKEAGISLNNGSRKLRSVAQTFPLEVIYLRDDDIPQYVQDGVAHIGIVGENEYAEKECKVDLLEKLGYSRCRLSIAIPKSESYHSLEDLNGKRIATSYPVILQNYLQEHGVKADIHVLSGSVELAPSIGMADAIFDIVSSGSTLISNGLKEVEVIMLSEAVVIANPNLDAEVQAILDDLIFRIRSVMAASNNKYILLNAPNENLQEIIDIIPGMKSPTVMPLAESGWSSVHSVLSEKEFWGVIDRLRELGAQGILVIPIEKMIV